MQEELIYLDLNNDRKIFVHIHLPEKSNNDLFIFLNPIFDEKKRVQKFQAQTARDLCKAGYHVIRFDYYGTGDSKGELFEFDILSSLHDIDFLYKHFNSKFNIKNIHLMGIRFGADLAYFAAKHIKNVNRLYIIEPVVDGKHYLLEQRTRRKAFKKFNKIDIDDHIHINDDVYEDHQGYPVSKKNLDFLENLNLGDHQAKADSIILIKLNVLYTKRRISNFKNSIVHGKMDYIEVNCSDFWASLEEVNTSELTSLIVQRAKE